MSVETGKQGYFSLRLDKWVYPEDEADIEAIYGPNPFRPTIQTDNLEKSPFNFISLTERVFGVGTRRIYLALGTLGRLTLHRPQSRSAILFR